MSLDVHLELVPGREVFSGNITHNLGAMADAVGIYIACWRPEEIPGDTAERLIKPLSVGLDALLERPDHYEQFNAPNGWGLYEHFVPCVRRYLEACKTWPHATVRVSR